MDPIIEKKLEEIGDLNQKIFILEQEIKNRKIELKSNDLINCSTCGIKFSSKKAIVDEKCPHINPYLPQYFICKFCSIKCQNNHVNALDSY